MKKLICTLFLALTVALVTSPVAFAADVVETESIAISITLEGDPYVDVVTSDGLPVAWSGVVLGATGWQAADNHLEVTYLLPPNGGISINTQNAGDAPGLVGVVDSDNVLSMAWRVVNASDEVSDVIHDHVYSEPDDGIDYNEDGDMEDYIAKLTVEAVKPDWDDVYAVWIWMLDGPVSAMATVTDETYSSPVTGAGIQHAEMTFGSWAGSPDYISLAADFTQGIPQAYSSALRVELYTE